MTWAPMTVMSRAIRRTVEEYAPTLKELPNDVLNDFVQIVGAYYFDLKGEQERRQKEPS